MAKPPNLTSDTEGWRAVLRARGLYGQGDLTLEQFWVEVEAIANIMQVLPYRQAVDEAVTELATATGTPIQLLQPPTTSAPEGAP